MTGIHVSRLSRENEKPLGAHLRTVVDNRYRLRTDQCSGISRTWSRVPLGRICRDLRNSMIESRL